MTFWAADQHLTPWAYLMNYPGTNQVKHPGGMVWFGRNLVQTSDGYVKDSICKELVRLVTRLRGCLVNTLDSITGIDSMGLHEARWSYRVIAQHVGRTDVPVAQCRIQRAPEGPHTRCEGSRQTTPRKDRRIVHQVLQNTIFSDKHLKGHL